MKKVLFIAFVLGISACGQKENNDESLATEQSTQRLVERAEMLSTKGFGEARLSDYGFFEGRLSDLHPASNRVVPYELITPLFTDYADKERYIYLPDSSWMEYHDEEVFGFPEGTILIKNFLYEESIVGDQKQRQVIETRLLHKEKDEWIPKSYVWNQEQTEAYLAVSGAKRDITFEHMGQAKNVVYEVPTVNQCKSCHMLNGKITPIGPTARQLHRTNREASYVVKWAEANLLQQVPSEVPLLAKWDDDRWALDDRARAYLDINCGPCHRPGGPGKTSGLNLTVFAEEGYELGIGKKPVAAGKGSGGRSYDIVPGDPDASILVYRMKSNDPGIMMPELGRTSIHAEGVELIEEWIRSMEEKKQISLIFAPNQKD